MIRVIAVNFGKFCQGKGNLVQVLARKSGFAPLKKIKAWVFYLIPQKHGGGGGGGGFNFLSFQYSTK